MISEQQIIIYNKLIHSSKRPSYGVRHIFALFGFLGFVNVYAMRVNLSIAIVSMVNNTNQNEGIQRINHTVDCCHGFSQINSTRINKNQGGYKFDWDAETQSTVLGSFFYGYVSCLLIVSMKKYLL